MDSSGSISRNRQEFIVDNAEFHNSPGKAIKEVSFAFNEAILTKQPDAKIIIPPPSVAVISWKANTQRDDHFRILQDEGCMVWQKKNNYGLRSHIELAILR
ncbi:TPA: hypothetical protein JBB30_01065 [Legionella pneumophila subsp. pneumophila]|nr:hypothetical protein [Legionella pneumophila subsp. pneumophila]